MFLDLEKQLLFYGAYHHNSINVGIHIVCVPLILWTSLTLLTNTPSIPLPSWASVPNLPLNVGTVGAVLYSTLYVLMEPVAGALAAPLILGGTAFGNHLTTTYGATTNQWAGAVHIVCWIAQFIGHGAFEGRAPALLDNLVQALFLAPFFVWFEILFSLGYRPDLKRRVDTAVELEIQRFRSEKQKQKENGAANGTKKSS
ncbi:DUF962-domain-containing protein [Amniculicola lignicola CBS 123094]|uniref:DUF962-domain-containing protein n=1 Tax=Amniculicola lignicola CBS 123094 TaxID=1392246 RepID=A0A6A5WDH8_9PLEO|nr:DUF962-domain-containing protein [Amniculicola lignicola CBS 123094]